MRIEPRQGCVVLSSECTSSAPRGAFRERLHANEAGVLLGNAWAAVVGQRADPKTTALLTAHWAVETDAGRAMPGHNFAGIKASAAATGALFRTVEGHGATRREVDARFRVYANPEAGAQDYVHLLASRYPAALAAARVGDAHGFSKALAEGGYFTADPQAYAAALCHRLALLQGATTEASTAPSAPAHWALQALLHAFRGPEEES